MRVKRIICMVLACVAIVGAVSVPASAAEIEITALENFTDKLIAPLCNKIVQYEHSCKIQGNSEQQLSFGCVGNGYH